VEKKEEIVMKTIVLMSRKSSVLDIGMRKGEDLCYVVLDMDGVVKKCIGE
jgi:hypothetical protein